jgi:hypothetical protein
MRRTNSRGLGDAQVGGVVTSGKNDKVGDTEGPCNVNKVLETVGLGLLRTREQ